MKWLKQTGGVFSTFDKINVIRCGIKSNNNIAPVYCTLLLYHSKQLTGISALNPEIFEN
jgi:hypothetical protein